MNLINNNPYRILGLPLTANEREITRQINSLSTYAEMGKVKSLDTDFPFLSSVERTPSAIEEAKKQIEQGESKLLYSLFWFWKNNTVDDIGFELLKEGNTEKAIAIWEKSVFANKRKVYKPIVLYENLIRQSSNWSKEESEDHSLKKNEDEYIIERKKETGSSIPVVHADLDNSENWTIEVDTEWRDGIENYGYGIIFGRKEGNYFTFDLSASGYYCFNKNVEWSFNEIIAWRKCEAVRKRSRNHIMIKKIENELQLYINDTHVETVQSQPFFGNFFGFRITKNQKVAFRNFRFSKLVEDETYGAGVEVSSKNFSNIKNLSNLYLGLSLAPSNGGFHIGHFKKGIALAKNIFSNGNMDEYAKLIAGERYDYKPIKTIQFYITEVVDSLKPFLDKSDGFSTSQLIGLFGGFPIEARQILNNKFLYKQVQNIEREIEIAEYERKKSADTATESGKKLVASTKADIQYLKKILGEADYQYHAIADKLCLAIIQCGIDAFNKCKTASGEIDYTKAITSEEGYLHEYEYALSIAVTQRTKDKAKENLDSCKHLIENKLYYSCWFCEKNPPDETGKFEITIYKETYRSYFPRRVQFSYVPVSIPRCSKCQQIHSQTSDVSFIALIGLAVAGLTIGGLAGGFWIAGLFVGAFIGWALGQSLKSQKTSKANIKDASRTTIRNYPVLSKLISEGWQFSKPSA